MEVKIQAIHFDATQKLEEFINKKIARLERHYGDLSLAQVTLKVVKPETAMNKEAQVKISAPQSFEMVAKKTADTFEEAIDLCLEAVEKQLEKRKNAL